MYYCDMHKDIPFPCYLKPYFKTLYSVTLTANLWKPETKYQENKVSDSRNFSTTKQAHADPLKHTTVQKFGFVKMYYF